MRTICFLSGLFLCFSSFGQAEVSVEIDISSDTIYMDNAFRLVLRVKNGNIQGMEQGPAPESCDLLQGPGRSSSMSIINGVQTSEESLSYYFRPTRPGKIKIPEVVLQVNGSTFTTKALEVIVMPNPEGWHQDPNTGQIEGQSLKKKKSSKRKRYRI